ncbi:MAG: hypothetical protein ABSH34_13630 [Verrucomicrobiota bacterium]
MEIPLPEEPERHEIFEVHLRGKPAARNVKISELVTGSQRLSGAQIPSACNLAALRALRRAVALADGSATGVAAPRQSAADPLGAMALAGGSAAAAGKGAAHGAHGDVGCAAPKGGQHARAQHFLGPVKGSVLHLSTIGFTPRVHSGR